jgi:hypothetical protein
MALALCPPSKDIMLSDHYKADLAIINAIIGEHKQSLDIIEELLSSHSNYFWADIKYHWVLNKIFNNNKRFNDIINKDKKIFLENITYNQKIYYQ